MKRFLFCLSTIYLSLPLFGDITNSRRLPDFTSYREICRIAVENDSFFAEFKHNGTYRAILEHVSQEDGRKYLDVIARQSPDFLNAIDVFRKNDLIGQPVTYVYNEIGTISPTTLRYLKVASDLNLLFGSLDQKSIIEIGGGYGGQCLILSALYKFKNYTIIDLPEPLALTKKYLERHNIHNVIYKTSDEAIQGQIFDLVISNYAHNECPQEIQKKYMREILIHSKRGYITGLWLENTIDFLRNNGIPCEEFPENPLTGPENILLVWK